MLSFFDSHAHYDDSAFDDDRGALLSAMPLNNVAYILNAGVNCASSLASVQLAEKYPYIFASVGIHPEDVERNENVDTIKLLAKAKKVVAIGEIGLDYHYDMPKDLQKKYFSEQLLLANDLNLPIIIHNREAHKDTLDILKSATLKRGGVLHCYSGSIEMTRELLDMNFFFGFGGVITFANAKKSLELLKYIPLDRILIETDAPYMTPVPFRGSRNSSIYLNYIVEKIAEIKELSCEEIATTTLSNAKMLFDIDN